MKTIDISTGHQFIQHNVDQANTNDVSISQPMIVRDSTIKNTGVVRNELNDDRKKHWQAETTTNVTGLFILPYVVTPAPEPTPGTGVVNTDMQGPNLALGKDVNSLFTQPGIASFVNKLNVFRDVYQDKNPASGFFYYLPKNYNLKFNKENGNYSFYVYYLSAGDDARGKVIITAELTPNISRDDITLAEALLTTQMKQVIKLRPLPLRDTPKVSFGNSLTNFDVANESVTTNVPTDFLEPIIVSWRMDKRVDDLTGAMMNNIGITGNIEFLPHGEEEKAIAVPVKLKVNDLQTFGSMEYTQAGALFNGLSNSLDYPILLKQLIVMREKAANEISIETFPLSDYKVEPKTVFSSFSQNEKTSVLNGDVIKKIWVDYVIQACDACDDIVQSKIMGGTSDSRVKNIEVTTLTPLAYGGASSIKLLIKSKQGDPKGKSEVLLPIVNIARDNQTLSGGELFVAEGSLADYQYQLVMIKPDGETLMSDWIPSHELFIIIGEKTIRDNFETTATSAETTT
jgi:hypothetical protein